MVDTGGIDWRTLTPAITFSPNVSKQHSADCDNWAYTELVGVTPLSCLTLVNTIFSKNLPFKIGHFGDFIR